LNQLGGFSAFSIYVSNYHFGTMARKKDRCCATDSSSAPGNDRDFIGEVELSRAEGHDKRARYFLMRFDQLASSIINLTRVLEPSLHSDGR